MDLLLAYGITAGCVVLREWRHVSPAAAGYLAGAVCLLGTVSSLLDLLSHHLLMRAPRPLLSGLLLGSVVAVPTLWGLWRFSQAREALSLWTPVGLSALGAGLAVATLWWLRRLSRAVLALCVSWAGATCLVWTLAHVSTDTLLSVRPGTEKLHLALYLVTWIGAAWIVPAAGWRAAAVPRRAPLRVLLAGAQATAGITLLEVDRHTLVGSYPGVHAWLGVMGVTVLALAIHALGYGALAPLSRVKARAGAGAARLARSRRAAGGLVVAGACLFLIMAPRAAATARSQLARTALGSSIVEALPQPGRSAAAGSPHPALDYSRFADHPPGIEKPNLLLITVDALRADHVAKMRELSRIGRAGTLFTRAYAQGSRTAIGMGTLLTGRYSANIDWQLWVYNRGHIMDRARMTSEELRTLGTRFVFTTVPGLGPGELLAERVQAAGYRTSAVPFAGNNQFFRKGVGFDRGFEEFVDLTAEPWSAPTSARVVAHSLEILSERGAEPWFHWLHLYDPHEAEGSKALYARYVKEVDKGIGRLVRWLESSGQWQRTVIAVLADHGEAFGEHGHASHGSSLYDEQVRIPLVLRVPGVEPSVIDDVVGAIDATTTLGVLAGASTEGWDGMNLLPRARGQVTALDRPVFTELHRYLSSSGKPTSDLKAIVLGNWKLIHDRKRGTVELYDLHADPAEQHDLADQRTDRLSELQDILASFLARAEAEHPLP